MSPDSMRPATGNGRQTMLLIGMDEAGYGPRLGPLCHGCCALRLAGAYRGEPPDLWAILHPVVMRHPAAAGSLTVDDSKKVYAAAAGLDLLAHGVSAFLASMNDAPVPAALYDRLLPESDRRRLEEDAWGKLGTVTCFPGTQVTVPGFNSLREALRARGISVLALGARALSARHFNAALRDGCNKADVSWAVIAAQLQPLLALAEPGETVHAVIDRQGGRKFYAGNVGPLFPGAMVWVEAETPHASVYRVETDGRVVRVAFLVNAESASLPVALASMTAKLTRELCMQRFNAFFQSHLPSLAPTAGYHTDALRFLKETHALRQALAIPDDVLIRTK